MISEKASEMTATSDAPARLVSSALACVFCLIRRTQETARNAVNARRVKFVTPESTSAWKTLGVMATNFAKKVKYDLVTRVCRSVAVEVFPVKAQT